MSATTDPELDPTEGQNTSSESKSTQDEVNTTIHAKGTEGAKGTTSYTEMVTSAATSAATTATTAAAGVKDNVFSMFGGGAKKEKKEEPEEPEDRSGSSKAKKDAKAVEAEAEVEVSPRSTGHSRFVDLLTLHSPCRGKMLPNLQKYILSQWCISPRKSRPRPTRSWRSKHSRCAPSSLNLTGIVENGRSEARVM